jgi:hypothetical protein
LNRRFDVQGCTGFVAYHSDLCVAVAGGSVKGTACPDSVTIGGIMFAMSEVADFLVGGVVLVLILFFSSLE